MTGQVCCRLEHQPRLEMKQHLDLSNQWLSHHQTYLQLYVDLHVRFDHQTTTVKRRSVIYWLDICGMLVLLWFCYGFVMCDAISCCIYIYLSFVHINSWMSFYYNLNYINLPATSVQILHIQNKLVIKEIPQDWIPISGLDKCYRSYWATFDYLS